MSRMHVIALVTAAALAACGDTKEDRALSGAGLGAAAGAAVGAVTGLTIVEGAIIGAAAGAITGIVTDREQIDLGRPLWRSNSQSGGTAPAVSQATLRNIQAGLTRLGFDPGPVDGKIGPRTRAAIRAYQQQHRLPVDGEPSEQLWTHIQQRL